MPGIPVIAEPSVLPNLVSELLKWGSVSQSEFCNSVNDAYEFVVHIRSNLFNTYRQVLRVNTLSMNSLTGSNRSMHVNLN